MHTWTYLLSKIVQLLLSKYTVSWDEKENGYENVSKPHSKSVKTYALSAWRLRPCTLRDNKHNKFA